MDSSSSASRTPDSGAATSPAPVEALASECKALRAELAQLRSHLAAAEQAAQSISISPLAENAAHHLLQEFQAVFDAAGVGMAVMHYRTLRRCNRAMTRMFGYAPGALDQQPIDLLHGDGERWLQVGERIRETMRKGEVYQDECELQQRDGSRLWVRRTGCAIRGNDLEQGTVWVYEDITARRDAERDMRQAKEMAEQATRMKSEFLANMRHEIRTPMNNILGMAQLALGSGLAAPQQAQVRSIRTSAQHLFGMLNDIVDLSALEAGKLTLQSQAFSPRALVQDVAMQTRDAALAKGLTFWTELADDLPGALVGDAEQLRRALTILVRNAIKFTPQGEVEIVARMLEVDGPTGVLRLEVHDTGIGLGPEGAASLFQPFAQADNSATRRHGGAGLGLSLCQALARGMGGAVQAHSREGQGSVFWLTLRLPIVDDVAAPPHMQRRRNADRRAQADVAPVDTAQLDHLDALLADADPEALQWLAQHSQGLHARAGEDFSAFAALVRSFDFDAARVQLKTLRDISDTGRD